MDAAIANKIVRINICKIMKGPYQIIMLLLIFVTKFGIQIWVIQHNVKVEYFNIAQFHEYFASALIECSVQTLHKRGPVHHPRKVNDLKLTSYTMMNNPVLKIESRLARRDTVSIGQHSVKNLCSVNVSYPSV